MSAEVFIDTNIFIYHLDSTDARKHAVALWKVAPLSVESWRTLLCALRGY